MNSLLRFLALALAFVLMFSCCAIATEGDGDGAPVQPVQTVESEEAEPAKDADGEPTPETDPEAKPEDDEEAPVGDEEENPAEEPEAEAPDDSETETGDDADGEPDDETNDVPGGETVEEPDSDQPAEEPVKLKQIPEFVSANAECKHENTNWHWEVLNGDYTDIDEYGHTFVGEIAMQYYCRDCATKWIDVSTAKPYTMRSAHEMEVFSEGCWYCGYVFNCTHEKTHLYGFEDSETLKYSPVDSIFHSVSGKTVGYYKCVTCGEEEEKEVTLINKKDGHSFQDGFCKYCGAAKQEVEVTVCRHENVEKENWFRRKTYTASDETGHMAVGDIEDRYYCPDCGESWSETIEINVTRWEKHDFSYGACWLCKYKNLCQHVNTETITDIVFGDGTYIAYITPYTHTMFGDFVVWVTCKDCGEGWQAEEPFITYQGVTEKHCFDRFGRCEEWGCNYVRSACPHSNATGAEVYLNAKYTSLNENEHSVTGYKTTAYTCPDCGESWQDYPGYNKTTASENHNFVNDVCKDCGYRKAAEGQAEPPKSVSIVQQNQKLNLGDTLQLTAEISPAGASTTLTWSSSDAKIATVDENGLVTPVKEGSVTITVKTANGKSGATKITVVDPYKLTGVKLDKTGTVNLNLGEMLTLIPSPVPETALSTYTWKTSSTKIATVVDGVVTPVGEGTATITVTAKRGSIAKTASVKVKVVDPYKPTSVKLDRTGTVNLNLGESLTLTPSLSPETAQATYSWKTSSTKIATVADGVVTPVGEGTATITVTAKRGSITKTASVKVKVVDPYKPTSVKLDKTGTLNLNLGESLTLTPSLSPETAQATYSWKTSSTKIATVVDGVVTPVGEGTATITVTAKRGSIAKTATVKVKVVDPYKPTVVKLDKTGTVNLNLGESLTLTPSLSPETAQATYSWKTSSTKIATVADGVVTPVGEGTATITVTATRGKIKKTATVKVKVFDPYKPTSVKLDKTGTVSLNLGESLTLTPSLSPETAQATYSWKTSSTKIATVADGMVTPVGEGTATIIVTATRGKIKKTATVKVKVVDPYKPTSLKLKETGTVWLELGDSTQLTPILGPETAKATYSWKTSSTKIATVDENGVVRPVAKGTATITVTATRGKIKKTASVKVKVVEPYVVDALVLSHRDAPKDLKVKVGELCDVTVSVKPASAQATANLSFTASNGNVSVTKQASNKFRVTGVKAGTTTITVKDVNTGLKTTMKVVVTK